MYEALTAPLPDSSLYLDRIGWKGPITLTQDTISALVFAHQKTVPFENYDICELGRPISLDVDHLYDKVVTNRRGGYCFELNGCFGPLLRALGFEVWPILATLYRALTGEIPSPPSHRVNLICLDGKKYFADVGFGGPMPAGALVLEEGLVQDVRGFRYFFEKRPHNRWVLFRETSEKEAEPMLGFCEAPSQEVDFVTPNFYTSTQPESMFVRSRIANIRFDDGVASISNGQFRLARGGAETTIAIESKEQELAILQEHFGIVLGGPDT